MSKLKYTSLPKCISWDYFAVGFLLLGVGGRVLPLTVKLNDKLCVVKGFSLQVLFQKIHWDFVHLWFLLLTKEVLSELENFE